MSVGLQKGRLIVFLVQVSASSEPRCNTWNTHVPLNRNCFVGHMYTADFANNPDRTAGSILVRQNRCNSSFQSRQSQSQSMLFLAPEFGLRELNCQTKVVVPSRDN